MKFQGKSSKCNYLDNHKTNFALSYKIIFNDVKLKNMKQFILMISLFVFGVNMQAQSLDNYRLMSDEALKLNVDIPEYIPIQQVNDVSLKQTLLHKKWDKNYAYSYDKLAFFCKIEVKLEKQTKLPIKVRLGEVNYTEKLEGKPYSKFY